MLVADGKHVRIISQHPFEDILPDQRMQAIMIYYVIFFFLSSKEKSSLVCFACILSKLRRQIEIKEILI